MVPPTPQENPQASANWDESPRPRYSIFSQTSALSQHVWIRGVLTPSPKHHLDWATTQNRRNAAGSKSALAVVYTLQSKQTQDVYTFTCMYVCMHVCRYVCMYKGASNNSPNNSNNSLHSSVNLNSSPNNSNNLPNNSNNSPNNSNNSPNNSNNSPNNSNNSNNSQNNSNNSQNKSNNSNNSSTNAGKHVAIHFAIEPPGSTAQSPGSKEGPGNATADTSILDVIARSLARRNRREARRNRREAWRNRREARRNRRVQPPGRSALFMARLCPRPKPHPLVTYYCPPGIPQWKYDLVKVCGLFANCIRVGSALFSGMVGKDVLPWSRWSLLSNLQRTIGVISGVYVVTTMTCGFDSVHSPFYVTLIMALRGDPYIHARMRLHVTYRRPYTFKADTANHEAFR